MINELTYKEVWQTLNAEDLSEFHDKKGNFTYLSWTDAWERLMRIYPFATYEFLPETYEQNGSVMSHCTVRIGNLERSMWLPCMDNKNNAINQPNSRQTNDSKMRCLVKCLAMFGLGLDVYGAKESIDLEPESVGDVDDALPGPEKDVPLLINKTEHDVLSELIKKT